MLNETERKRVEEAVRRAETGTAGEIVVILARQAASYRSVPLLYGLVAALILPWPLIALTALPAGRIFALQAAAALAVLAVASLQTVRLRLVPPAWKRARAREAAEREFRARGLADTRGRTGVLLYVAEAERFAEVIGDVTISAGIPPESWRPAIEALVSAFATERRAEGLEAAIEAIGEILARHVPRDAADADELPNRVVLI